MMGKRQLPKRGSNLPITRGEFENLEEEVEDLEEKVNRLVKSSIDSQLKIYKVAITAFLAGLLLFVSAGLITKGELLEPIFKSIYKPANIYKDIQPNIPTGVWTAITSGTTDDYKRFVSKDEFYNALAEYHTNLVKTFLIPNREPIVRAQEIMKAGGIFENVHILMGGKLIEGHPTSRCNKEFRNTDKQAIIVVPQSYERSDYAWFDCAFGWPRMTLGIDYQGNYVDNIELVGVRRNGGTKQLIVLVSQKAAQELDLPGWQEYKANAFGKIRVSDVDVD